MRRPAEIAAQVATLAAALGVGMLLGARYCAEPAAPFAPPASLAEQEAPTQGTAQRAQSRDAATAEAPHCPEPAPCDCPCAPPKPAPTAGKAPSRRPTPTPAPPVASLPQAPGPSSPQTRQRLLAWVRDQSPTLGRCHHLGHEVLRLNASLRVAPDGQVQKATLNAPPETPVPVRDCLREALERWKIPTELTEGREVVVFALTL